MWVCGIWKERGESHLRTCSDEVRFFSNTRASFAETTYTLPGPNGLYYMLNTFNERFKKNLRSKRAGMLSNLFFVCFQTKWIARQVCRGWNIDSIYLHMCGKSGEISCTGSVLKNKKTYILCVCTHVFCVFNALLTYFSSIKRDTHTIQVGRSI
jgi:hypothetical protein